MKVKCKVILIILSLMIIIFSFSISNFSYSFETDLGDLNNYKNEAQNPKTLSEKVGKVLGIVQTAGTVVSVAMLIVIGIKFMMGSVEEKSEYKKSMQPYLIGAFMLFTGTLLPQIIYKFSQSIG